MKIVSFTPTMIIIKWTDGEDEVYFRIAPRNHIYPLAITTSRGIFKYLGITQNTPNLSFENLLEKKTEFLLTLFFVREHTIYKYWNLLYTDNISFKELVQAVKNTLKRETAMKKQIEQFLNIVKMKDEKLAKKIRCEFLAKKFLSFLEG